MAIIIETCPECGHDLIDEMICTNPPIPRKFCPNCGWRWEGKQDEVIKIRFGENMIDSEDKLLAQEANVKSMLEQLKKVEIKEEENYMEQVAKILGVKLNEEFYIEDSDYKYKITKDGMKLYSELGDYWNSANYALGEILSGERKIKKPILDEKEKEYLSAVIKPFRDQIIYIVKLNDIDNQCIEIKLRGIDGYVKYIFFPPFKKSSMYKGMELKKEYTLKDLEL